MLACSRQLAHCLGLLLVAWGVGGPARTSRADETEAKVARFVERIQPLFASKCISCHGPDKQEGNLRLDSLVHAQRGGDRGAAVVPGDPGKSLLVAAIQFADPDLQMPPKQKLSTDEIADLTEWVASGATWPRPPQVLFDEDPAFLQDLRNGNGKGRMVVGNAASGRFSVGIGPLQRDNPSLPNWSFPIRERPGPGEFRYLQFRWKKRGPGGVMIELASSGKWPDAQSAAGRYFAGTNTTGWSAKQISDQVPSEWTTVTCDLWRDLGDCTLTGIAPTCDGGEEAYFDAILLADSTDSLSTYRGERPVEIADESGPIGDAWSDPRNPIRQIFRGKRLDLWSLKPPVRPAVPVGENLPSHPIDAFVQQRLAATGLQPSSPADRRTLIRRLSFDLLGLPPTYAEVEAFASDASPTAVSALIDRLLQSPQYGERQARLWLDVVRYADTNGYERDEFRPLVWRYRNYVIRAFNSDKPYDEFVREQLAGDELNDGPPRDAAEVDRLLATGYLRLGQWDSTASIFQEEDRLRAEQMADLTNTTASAFLGLTMACCQCHDHKYDPFSQADHFRLRAFFAGVKPVDDAVISLPEELAEIARHNEPLEKELASLKAELKKAEKDSARERELRAEITAREGQLRVPQRAMAVADAGKETPATRVFFQGDFHSPREEVPPGFFSFADPGPADVNLPQRTGARRRLALAQWITSTRNPWTARVFVNRVWQQYFGRGLVATPNDFGFSGSTPTHPELLDWLADEFMRNGWSVKELHRLILTSATYQQSSSSHPAGTAKDPENRELWRQNVRRLDAETLRDSMLRVAGLLRFDAVEKPRWPEVPEELLHAQPAILEAEKGGDGGRMQGWYADPVEQTDVRSIYLIRKRCLPVPFLQVFDLPDTSTSCARRDTTVVAPQALTLLNSPESLRYAREFAARVLREAGDSLDRQIDTAFQLALGRPPEPDERALARQLVEQQQRWQPTAEGSLAELTRALLNLNEFAYFD